MNNNAQQPIAARAQADSVAAPAGWKRVPVKPTPEMVAAAWAVGTEAGGIQDVDEAWTAMLAAAPTPPAQAADSVLEDAALPEAVIDAVAESLGDAYDCGRGWSAWSYGTMGPDDFSMVAEDGDRVAEIATAAIEAYRAAMAAKKGGEA